MKFSMCVKLMSLLAAVLVMLVGLPVVRAEAGLPPSPELDAFFDSNAKPGAESPLFSGLVLNDRGGNNINQLFDISVHGWNGFKELLAAIDTEDLGDFDPIGRLTNLMNEAKEEYYFDKAHFTFFRIVGRNPGDRDKIAWNGADYVLSEGELFVESDLEEFYKKLTTDVFMGGFGENETGFVTFTPIRSLIPNPVNPTNPGVVKVEPTRTGTDVVIANPELNLGGVTTSGYTNVSAVNTSNVDSTTIIGLPVFEVESNQTAFMGYSTTLNDIAAKGYKVKDLTFLKRRANGTIVKFDRIENPTNVGNGQFAVTLLDSPTAALNSDASIASDTMYLFSFGIQDDGDYDWNNTVAGNIVDPAAIAASQTQNGGGSSGGCNAGFGIVGILLAGIVIRKYRKV